MNEKKAKELYFKIRYGKRVTDYKTVASSSENYDLESMDEESARAKYGKNGGIDKYICDVMESELKTNFNKDDLCKIKKYFEEYHDIYSTYFNEDREDIFIEHNKCVTWFKSQNNKCCYCGVHGNDANKHEVFENAKRGRGKILEIERVVTFPTNDYSFDNCRLACHICNNAKSDFLSVQDFEPIAEGIKKFWEKKLKKNIEFPTGIYEQF